MKADAISLAKLFRESGIKFIVPVYQRNYDWKEEECNVLFKDIESIHNKNREKHFIGSIVYISNSETSVIGINEYVIIDGQQRITSSMLFLKALFDITNDEELKAKIL